MLQERNQTSRNRSNLLGRHINKVNLRRLYNWIISILTTFYNITDERTIFRQRSISLTDNLILLILSSEIYHILVVHIHLTVCYLTIRSDDKSKVINLCIHTE